jgi:transcription initiation factor TFIIIB Brf1 subunit/transcription initiation factor TFIIB
MNSEIWNLFNEINESFSNIENLDSSFKTLDLKDKSVKDIEIINEIDTEIDTEKECVKDPTKNNTIRSSKIKDKCINCNQEGFLVCDSENIVCTFCGCENDSIIDMGAEWRFYGNDDNKKSSDPTRCGMPSNQHIQDTSLSTVILGKGFEVYRKLNSWNGLTYKQRSLIGILNKIALKANIDNVPQSIIDATMNMYKMISQNYIKRGSSRESLIAACFFNALRDQGMIRSTDEVARLFDIKSKKLSKGCNEFTELMFIKNREYVKNMKPIESKDLIERFGTLLDIDPDYIEIGVRIAILVDKLGICQENNPKSIAVGVLYLLSATYDLKITKKEIADQCKTSEVTVSNTYCQMVKFKKYLIPK